MANKPNGAATPPDATTPDDDVTRDDATPDTTLVVLDTTSSEPEAAFKDGKLTRTGMEQAIREGGSVQLKDGRVVTKIDDLPSAAELAKGDPVAERAALADLQNQMADVQAQITNLQNG